MKILLNRNRTPSVLVASLILLCLPLFAQEQHDPEPPNAVDFTWGVKIPMRDGVNSKITGSPSF